MEELTLDQQKALILARARRRRAEAEGQQAQPEAAPPLDPDTGIFAGLKRAGSTLVSGIAHPIDTVKGLASEAATVTQPMVAVKRAQEAMQAARGEHGGTGLDPYLHGAVAALPFVGQHANELLTRSATDLPGAAAQAGAEIIGGKLIGEAAGKAKQVSGSNKAAIASAGAKFDQVMAAAKNEIIDTYPAGNEVVRAEQLSKTGAKLPKVLQDYMKHEGPMTYETGRDFASNAGDLSVIDTKRTNQKMRRQVTKFGKALDDANRAAAVKAGVGDLYDEAMQEWGKAMSNQAKIEWAKKWAKRGVAGYVLGKFVGAGMDFPTR